MKEKPRGVESISREEFVSRLIETIMELTSNVNSLHAILQQLEMFEDQGFRINFYADPKSGAVYFEKKEKERMGFGQ